MQPELSQFFANIPCRLVLPEEIAAGEGEKFFSPTLNDRRRFSRAYVGHTLSAAALEYRQTLPSIARTQSWHRVYMVDLSRGGLRLLHFEPLLPRESFPIVLANGSRREIVVVRCRRIGDHCFDIGVRFQGPATAEPAKQ